MPYLGGSGGGEWVAPPLGDQPVEVKRAQLYQLVREKLADPNAGYDRDRDGFPPPLEKCTRPDLAVGWKLSFGIYGPLETQWKSRHEGNVSVSWASTYTVIGRPCSIEQAKFYKTWERYIAPVLGGAADGVLREFVKEQGIDPGPDFFARILGSMRCRVAIDAVAAQTTTFYNVVYEGPEPKITSDPSQGNHNLGLLRQKLRLEQLASTRGPQPGSVDAQGVSVGQIMDIFNNLKDAGIKNESALKADCWQVSKTRAEFVDELSPSEAQLLFVAYQTLLAEFEQKSQAGQLAGSGDAVEAPKATAAQKTKLEELFKVCSQDVNLGLDEALAAIRSVLGPNAEERKAAAGGFYMNALTRGEAEQLIRDFESAIEIPF